MDVIDDVVYITVIPENNKRNSYIKCISVLIDYLGGTENTNLEAGHLNFPGGVLTIPSLTEPIVEPITAYTNNKEFVSYCKNSFYKHNIEAEMEYRMSEL